MNALLLQFIEEGRELLEAVEEGLLTLERNPTETETLNEVFRAAHTFKGSSGLFDMPELTRLTHVCEDVLDAARAGDADLTSEILDRLHVAFDLVRLWLDELAVSERLPADAAVRAADVIRELRMGDDPVTAAPGTTVAAPTAAGDGRWRVTYRPEAGCFFRGDDPLHLVSQIPELVHLDVRRDGPWPAIADLDEFDCAVWFVATTTAGRDELEFLFRFVADEVTIEAEPHEPAAVEKVAGADGPDDALVELLRVQRTVLATEGPSSGVSGRIRSSAAIARTIAVRLGRDPGEIADAEARSIADGTCAPLLALVDRVLAELTGGPDGPSPDAAAGASADRPGEPLDGASFGAKATASGPRPLKVDQGKVDRLLELAGELVVAKNALPFLAREAEEHYGVSALARQIKDQYTAMNRLAEELQHAVMDIRMVPVSVALQRFPRLVRDLARKLGKEVRLVTEGEHTQADKDVLELLGDPLLHLVRNSLDHGIETPDDRRAAGKPAEATLQLSAWQEADSVLIRVSDDGHGIDPVALRRKATAKGLITADAAERLSDREALGLIFLPGFSTAEQISDVSGRGVGMDVVRSTITRLGGDVRLESELGIGTHVTIRLPLTMSVMSVMTVSAGGQRFGLPLDLVQATVKVPHAEVGSVQRRATIVLRGGLVPVIDLADALGLPPTEATTDLTVCVVRVEDHVVGLAVDRFHDNVDVILKPLEGVMRGVRCYAGTALMGNGEVLLVLNANEVVRHAPARC